MDAPIRDDVPQLLVGINRSVQQWVLVGQIENLDEGVERVGAVSQRGGVARAFQLIPNGQLEFSAMDILEDEACAPCNAYQVKFL